MNENLKTSSAGLDIIKASEGFRDRTYLCPAGKPSIGYGHVKLPGETFQEPISQAQALSLLVKDVEKAAAAVERLVKVPLTQNQFDALVSLVFNIGSENFRTSTLLRKLNAGDYDSAALQFMKWCHARVRDPKTGAIELVVLPGLVQRREEEGSLFLAGAETKPGGSAPANSALGPGQS
jgi:lysozyme